MADSRLPDTRDAPVLVCAAAGNVGRAATSALRARDVPVRAGVRNPARFPSAPGVEAIELDLEQPATFAAAVAGVRGVLVIRPPQISRVGGTVNRLVDAGVRAGATQFTVLSVMGAERSRVIPHHRIEAHVRAVAPAWTMLRPGFFCQNILDAYGEDIRSDSRIYVPAGAGSVAWVDVRDIGEIAAQSFTQEGHVRQAYTLTGPRADTFAAVAEELSSRLGRRIRYEPASILGYLRHLRATGLGVTQSVVQTLLHAGLRKGQRPDPTLSRLLDRPPRDVRDYLSEFSQTMR